MLQVVTDLPDGVIGFTAIGKVTGEDYEKVVVPTIEAGFEKHPNLSLVYHLGPEFVGFEAAAMWDDAKVGLKHLTAWDRVAVVTDVGWIRGATKACGFLLPCRVRVYPNAELSMALAWASEAVGQGLDFKILPEAGVAILTPKKRLRATDFEGVARAVDSYLVEHSSLKGIMIRAARFSGWESLSGLISHLRFVREHHRRVERVAMVTDGAVMAHMPVFASHFVAAEVRHFPANEEAAALAWLEGE